MRSSPRPTTRRFSTRLFSSRFFSTRGFALPPRCSPWGPPWGLSLGRQRAAALVSGLGLLAALSAAALAQPALPREGSPGAPSPRARSQRAASSQVVSPQAASPQAASPQAASPGPGSEAPSGPRAAPEEARHAIESAEELGQAFTAVAQRVSPSVVSIRVQARLPSRVAGRGPFGPFGPTPPEEGFAQGNGSGLVIRPDGYVLTNNHVIESAVRIEVQLQDGRRFDAEVVGIDPATDLAVLRIPARSLAALRFASADAIRPGQWAIAIGSPFGLDYSVTTGVVSFAGRGGLGMNEIEDYVQTDASINPGNSGGPLVNMDGDVIGINTMIVGRGSGIGFAVSSELALRVTEQLIARGEVRRAWIGVSFQELTPELSAAFSLGERARTGALIADVAEGGPAARAGLRPGDVVTGVDGEPVHEGRDLLRAVLRREIGTRLTLDVVRRGRHQPVLLTTTERPDAQRARPPALAPARPGGSPLEGLSLAPLSSEQRARLGADGALVADVAPGCEADRSGLRRGDVILEADGRSVRATDQVAQAAARGPVLLRVQRGENAFFAVLGS